MVSTEPTTEQAISICHKTIRGHLEVVTEPGNLRARVTAEGKSPVELRLPGDALERALLFDGDVAEVMYQETTLHGEAIDCTVGVVNSGTPLTGAEFVAALRNLFDSEEEQQAWLAAMDELNPPSEDG